MLARKRNEHAAFQHFVKGVPRQTIPKPGEFIHLHRFRFMNSISPTGSWLIGHHLCGMPKASPTWTCDVCGQVLPNEPKPVLKHVMSHAERRPLARSRPERPADDEPPKARDVH